MTPEQSAPDPDALSQGKRPRAGDLYRQVTPLRRQDVCGTLLVAHVAAMFAIGYVPLLFPVGILTTFGVVIVCFMALTGPIYVKRLNYSNKLEQWGKANKVAAIIILILFVASYGFLIYWFFFRT